MPCSKRQLLQKIAIFGALSDDALDFLVQRSDEIGYHPGELVFQEQDQASAMFIVASGKVAVLKNWEGKQYLLDHIESGGCFGEMALMDMHPRSASVFVVEEALVFRLGTAALLELYEHDTEQFVLLQMNLGREVSRRLRDAHERLFKWRVMGEVKGAPPLFCQTTATDGGLSNK